MKTKDELESALDKAFYDFISALDKVFDDCPDELLIEYAGEYSNNAPTDLSKALSEYLRWRANYSRLLRYSLAEAEAAMSADPSITAYCVYHGQDLRKCSDEHD